MDDKDQLNLLLQKTLQTCLRKEKLYGTEEVKQSYNRFFVLLDIKINHKRHTNHKHK
ncbi:hypothetical protein AB3Z07_05035 [Metabacillus halosaccharovorans]|uniref:hypothetical protein n=1 Tax=Metabacillus halosaccharovorans TaxID=930124 RepID=UPI0034D00951